MLRLSLCLLCLVTLSGCATIINGTKQNIAVTTTPDKAKVVAVGGDKTFECLTPCTLTLKRKYNYAVEVEREGYKKQTMQITSVISGAVAGNILLGGLIGWGVDSASGGDSRLVPETLSVNLEEDKKIADAALVAAAPPTSKSEELDAELARLRKMQEDGSLTKQEEAALRKKAMERF